MVFPFASKVRLVALPLLSNSQYELVVVLLPPSTAETLAVLAPPGSVPLPLKLRENARVARAVPESEADAVAHELYQLAVDCSRQESWYDCLMRYSTVILALGASACLQGCASKTVLVRGACDTCPELNSCVGKQVTIKGTFYKQGCKFGSAIKLSNEPACMICIEPIAADDHGIITSKLMRTGWFPVVGDDRHFRSIY